MKILVENKVPFLHGLLEEYADVDYAHPDEITPQRVRDVDAMIVRTRTRCDASLLGGSRCRFVATATIGTDHIDLSWCASRGIAVANAPGCNAPAVAQYVFGTIAAIPHAPHRRRPRPHPPPRIGRVDALPSAQTTRHKCRTRPGGGQRRARPGARPQSRGRRRRRLLGR